MKAPLSYVPALPAAAGLIAGIILGEWGCGIIAIVVGCIVFAALYFKGSHYYAFVSILVALGAILYMAHRPSALPEALQGSQRQYAATVTACDETTSGYAVCAEVDTCDGRPIAKVKAMLTIASYSIVLQPGQKIAFTAQLRGLPIPEQVPYEFNYSKYLQSQGLEAYAIVDPGKITITGQPSALQMFANEVRIGAFNAIVDSPISGQTAAFLVAAILRDDIFIEPEAKEAFRATGISHILALSGLHVGILGSLLGIMLAPLKLRRRGFYLQPLLTVVLIWGYAWLVGMAPSVTRAAVMMSVFIAARIVQRDSQPLNSLCLAAIVCLCISPASLFTPGFQLSFVAVLALLIVMPLIPRQLKRRPVLYFMANATLLPVAAMMGTGLISAYYFHVMPWLFLPANIVAGLIFPWLLGGGFILVFTTAIGMQLSWIGWIVDVLCSVLLRLSLWGSQLSWSASKVPYFSNFTFLPYIAAMACLAAAIYKRENKRVVLGCIFGCIGCLAATAACAAWIKPSLPRAELYMPTRKPAAILLRYADQAVLLPVSNLYAQSAPACMMEPMLYEYNRQYSGFLSNRGCGESFAWHSADTLQLGPMVIRNQCIAIGGKLIAVANSVGIPQVEADYALICPDYKGSVAAVQSACHPDTILIASEIAPMRERKLLRESLDSIPVISLRKSPFSIVIE